MRSSVRSLDGRRPQSHDEAEQGRRPSKEGPHCLGRENGFPVLRFRTKFGKRSRDQDMDQDRFGDLDTAVGADADPNGAANAIRSFTQRGTRRWRGVLDRRAWPVRSTDYVYGTVWVVGFSFAAAYENPSSSSSRGKTFLALSTLRMSDATASRLCGEGVD